MCGDIATIAAGLEAGNMNATTSVFASHWRSDVVSFGFEHGSRRTPDL
jgi:hypothetical protein